MLGALTEEQIDQLLSANLVGRIGCTDGEKVYIVPVCYAFNGEYLIVHSREGMKINFMRQNKRVCFEVDEIKDPANWRSVILWGEYEEVTAPRERYYAMKFLISRLMHHRTVSETAGMPELSRELAESPPAGGELRPVVYRIRIKERTGRFEKS